MEIYFKNSRLIYFLMTKIYHEKSIIEKFICIARHWIWDIFYILLRKKRDSLVNAMSRVYFRILERYKGGAKGISKYEEFQISFRRGITVLSSRGL